jgi:hypothetical protein
MMTLEERVAALTAQERKRAERLTAQERKRAERVSEQERKRLGRDERLADRKRILEDQARKRAERLQKVRNKLTQTRRESRSLDQQARVARRKRTGVDADEAGLFALEEPELKRLFVLLGQRLPEIPDLVALLDAVLCESDAPVSHARASDNGVALRPAVDGMVTIIRE